jgi:hypothetical protein
MKTGDIFHKMRPIQRLRHVVTRRYFMQEVYSSPDEVIADLSILFAELDSISASRDQIALDYRRLHKGRDEIINGITGAFKQFEYLYKALPDLPILYESPPNVTDHPDGLSLNNEEGLP